MKNAMLVALLALLSVGLAAQPTVTGSCQNGGAYPNCVGGEIVFVGSNYPERVQVTVTNSSGRVIDDGEYKTDGGILRFTENLSFADTYTIAINDQVVLVITTG